MKIVSQSKNESHFGAEFITFTASYFANSNKSIFL